MNNVIRLGVFAALTVVLIAKVYNDTKKLRSKQLRSDTNDSIVRDYVITAAELERTTDQGVRDLLEIKLQFYRDELSAHGVI